VPDGDLGKVIEHALAHLCNELRAKKLGTCRKAKATAAKRHKAATGAATEHAPEHAPDHATLALHEPAGKSRPSSVEAPAAPRSPRPTRHLPRVVRRAVAERDAYRCAYVSAEGRRCEVIAELEFHHVHPFARGGLSTVDNVQLRCKRHNQYEAMLDFGATFMAEKKGNKPNDPLSIAPST
jgi:5-methylcytosine-specific restriction endonuclease McrA